MVLGGILLPAQTASHKPAVAVRQQAASVQPLTPGGAPQVITLEQLQKRLEDLQAGRNQAEANMHAFDGAIAETKNWIKQLQSPPPAK